MRKFEGITFEPKGDEVAVYLALENHETGSVRRRFSATGARLA